MMHQHTRTTARWIGVADTAAGPVWQLHDGHTVIAEAPRRFGEHRPPHIVTEGVAYVRDGDRWVPAPATHPAFWPLMAAGFLCAAVAAVWPPAAVAGVAAILAAVIAESNKGGGR